MSVDDTLFETERYTGSGTHSLKAEWQHNPGEPGHYYLWARKDDLPPIMIGFTPEEFAEFVEALRKEKA